MGYTHYWTIRIGTDSEGWPEALAAARKVIEVAPRLLAGWDGEGEPELADGLSFNGRGPDAHETFAMPESTQGLQPHERFGGYWAFCKTAHKPYDVIVTAVLAAMEHTAPLCIEVTSDGDVADWQAGLVLARLALDDETVDVPKSVRIREVVV